MIFFSKDTALIKRLINFFVVIFLITGAYQNAIVCMEKNKNAVEQNEHDYLTQLRQKFKTAPSKDKFKIMYQMVKEKNKQDEGTMMIKEGSNEHF